MSITQTDKVELDTPLLSPASSVGNIVDMPIEAPLSLDSDPVSEKSALVASISPNNSISYHKNEQPSRKIWITLFVSILLGLVSGTLYGFGRYSQALKDLLSLSQTEISRFGILFDVGNYFGHPIMGYVFDHHGPRVCCLSATVMVFSAYGMIQVGVTEADNDPPLALFDIGFMMVGIGNGLGYIAGLGSTTRNFRGTAHAGKAVGMVAAGYGLCSTFVGITYHLVGLDDFFLLWAVLAPAVFIIGSIFVRIEDGTVVDITDDRLENDKYETAGTIPHKSPTSTVVTDIDEENLESDGQKREVSLSSWTTWRKFDFWILFVCFSCTTGCGLFVINNISTIVQSLGGEDSFTGVLVISSSICNCAGRIIMGMLTDLPSIGNVTLFKANSLLMAIGLLASAIAAPENALVLFSVTVVFVLTAYGMSWVLIVRILADWFGNEHFGKDYGFITLGPAISGTVFNFVSAKIYESHIVDSSEACDGLDCYRESFIFTSTSAATSFVLLMFMKKSKTQTTPGAHEQLNDNAENLSGNITTEA